MNPDGYVADYLIAPAGTVRPTEFLCNIRLHMQVDDIDEVPSIIVADDNRPVGVIRWSDIRDASDIPDTCMARDIMLSGYPTVRVDEPVSEALARLAFADLDRLPVVNNQGMLLGVVERATLVHTENGRSAMPPANSPSPEDQGGRRAFKVRPGMKVFSCNGKGIGLVDRIFLGQGTVTGFMVACGPAGHQHKHLGFDAVDHLEDQTIQLSINEDEFFSLPDVHA